MEQLPMYKQPSSEAEQEGTAVVDALGLGISIVFIVIAGLLFLAGESANEEIAGFIGRFALNFISILLEALPFMLIGTLVGGVIEVFVPTAMIDRLFSSRPTRAIFLAGGLGLFFPTCECAIVPIVRRLIIKGVPVPAAICFMLSGPIINIIVAWSTAVAYTYNWKVVFLRMGCGYIVAVIVGLLMHRFTDPSKLILPNVAELSFHQCGCCHDDAHESSLFSKLLHSINHARDDFLAVGKYLIIGAFAAALIRSAVPLSHFDSLMDAPWLSILLMMIMAIVMNLCSEADAFIASSFRWILPGSAQMGFLVLGPMLDLKLLLMYLSVFRKRTIALLSITIFSVVYLLMILLDLFVPDFL